MISIKSLLFFIFLLVILLSPHVFASNGWWNDSWEYRVPLNLTEKIGMNRTFYVIEQNLSFFRNITNCTEIRVTQCMEDNSDCTEEEEVPYEIISGGDSAWCEIEFIANITGLSWRLFYVYYGNNLSQNPGYGEYEKHWWNLYPNVTPHDLRDIEIVSDKEAYTVGGRPRYHTEDPPGRQVALKWNGSAWYEIPVEGGNGAALSSVSFSSPERGWAFGDHDGPGFVDKIFRWNPASQSFVFYSKPGADIMYDSDTCSDNFTILGGSWNSVWVWNGVYWKKFKSNLQCHIYGVEVISPEDSWGVGLLSDEKKCGVAHWNGTDWDASSCTSLVGNKALCAIECVNSSHCWSVGEGGAIMIYNSSWHAYDKINTGRDLFGVKIFSNDGWITGQKGSIIKYRKGWSEADSVTEKNLGGCWGGWGRPIDMLNSSYGWIVGEDGVMLHRGSVNVEVGDAESVTDKIKIIFKKNINFYIERNQIMEINVSCSNETLDGLGEGSFEFKVGNKTPGFRVVEKGNGSYEVFFTDLFEDTGQLGKFNLSVSIEYVLEGEKIEGSNRTEFQLLKIPVDSILVSDKDWRNIIAASATGNPVLIGDFVDMGNLSNEVFLMGQTDVFNFEGKFYKVNNRNSLQAMFLSEKRKIYAENKRQGIFAARLANEMGRIVVFNENECGGDCLNLSHMGIGELEKLFLDELGGTNYFIVANKNRENSLLAAQLSVYRKGLPVLFDLGDITYPSSNDPHDSGDVFNENNGLFEINEILREKMEKFGELEEDYVFGVMPKIAIIGTEGDMPYYVIWDMGLEDFVEEPSGDELWLKTDNYYGDLNGDIFMDVAVGRIKGNVEKGSWRILATKLMEEKECLKAGIIAEYNHPGGFDLFAQGGSMMNGFIANLGLRENYETERLVERRFSGGGGSMEDELMEKIKELVLKEIDKKLFWVYSKLVFSEKLLYILFERDWIGWEIPGVPHYLEEVSKERAVEILENRGITFFLGPGDTNEVVFYEEDRDIYIDPYPGPKLDLRDLEKTGFMFLDYSYSYGLDLPLNSPGFVGNTGLLHDTASRDTINYFAGNIEMGFGQALAESKNFIIKSYSRGEEGPKPKIKEFYEKVLISDPELGSGSFRPHGFFSAQKEGDYFYDRVEIIPEYEEDFYGFSSVILEPNRPVVPVYTKSMIIPSGSELIDIEVESNKMILENISLPIYRDEYYTQENFSGIYPEDYWWKNEREYLDGRKEIIFSVPLIYDIGKKEVLVNDFVFKVIYKAPLEIYDFYTISQAEGKTQSFHAVVYSNEKRQGEVLLRIYGTENDEIRKRVELAPGENEINFSWKAKSPGNYEAHLVLVSEEIHSGPRALKFKVMQKPNLLIQTKESVLQVWHSFKETISRFFSSGKIEAKKSSQINVEYWVENGKNLKRIASEEFVLVVVESGEERKINFTSPRGNILVREKKGNKEEIIHGSRKVREEFEKAKKYLRNELEFLK